MMILFIKGKKVIQTKPALCEKVFTLIVAQPVIRQSSSTIKCL